VLGRFTERDLTIIKVRWTGRAEYLMPEHRSYCMFTNTGTIEVDGRHRGRHTVVWSDYGEEVAVFGEPGAEALCIEFPSIEFAPDLAGRKSAG
jgi:redox-sensitive bicupin YhaK (pirin superfamily)